MNREEKLGAIAQRCRELLAQLRTPGQWADENGAVMAFPAGMVPIEICQLATNSDAAFISACAGAAEAGWRATLAAIECFIRLGCCELEVSHREELEDGMDQIISAWDVQY